MGAVPVDWQVRLAPGTEVSNATTSSGPPGVTATARRIRRHAGPRRAQRRPVRTTGPGVVLGLPPGYASAFPGEIRPLVGARDGVLLAQQTAANLGATVGSEITIGRPGLPRARVTVDGIVDLPAADSLFQSIGAAPGSARRRRRTTSSCSRPSGSPSSSQRGRASRPSSTSSSRTPPADPGAAFVDVTGRARNLEAALSGTGLVGDNIGARLDAARSDAVYAQLLFLFLGVPGVIVAALLAAVVAAAGRERRRREQALLRLRGATPRLIVGLAGAEALAVGAAGVLARARGRGRGRTGRVRDGRASARRTPRRSCGSRQRRRRDRARRAHDRRPGDLGRPLAHGGRGARRHRPAPPTPCGPGSYLDLVLLGAGALVYGQAVRSGYQVVLAPEGVPTISIGTFTLLAPALLWAGRRCSRGGSAPSCSNAVAASSNGSRDRSRAGWPAWSRRRCRDSGGCSRAPPC